MVVVEPVVHDLGINPEGERVTINQRLVVLRPISDGMKRRAHDADLKGMVVIRPPRPQLVPFKLHRFGQQRRYKAISEEDKSFGEIYLAMKFIPIADDGFQNDLFKPCDTDKYRVRSLLYLCFVMRVTL